MGFTRLSPLPFRLRAGGSLSWNPYEFVNWRHVVRRVWSEIREDDVLGVAAQLSYFLVFSLLPLLLIVSVILGYMAQGAEMRAALLAYSRKILPPSTLTLVSGTLEQLTKNASGKKLSIGILTTMWAASSGMTSIMDGLNRAYAVRDGRPWWKKQLVAAGLALALAVLVAIALVILLYGERFGGFLADWLGAGGTFETFWRMIEWPLAIAFVFLAFLMVYLFAPNLKWQKLRWLFPGTATAVILWLAVSFGLRLYLHHFSLYGPVYGSLGAILLLLLWLYLSSAALLVGGEINSEVEAAAASRGEPGAKSPGEKAPPEAA
jgi:membrane protein